MLDRFLEAGGTFIDTADVYGDGESERTLAPWLARHRDEVVLATKVRFAVSDPGGEGLAPDRIGAACNASLRRLGVDVIDLYQVHAPDPTVPLEDTLAALDGLVQARKVRALGASNFPAWLLAWAAGVAALLQGGRPGRPAVGTARGWDRPFKLHLRPIPLWDGRLSLIPFIHSQDSASPSSKPGRSPDRKS
jgi:aryl-alcohol dehydrogenase-like predicted oxidoreductase